MLPELDVRLQGARPGDILAFDAELPDGTVSLKVLVKDVKEKVLPEVTDEWASEASEFDTVDELRARRGRTDRDHQAPAGRPWPCATAPWKPWWSWSTSTRRLRRSRPRSNGALHDLQHRLEGQRVSIEQYLEATGQTPEQLVAGLREQAGGGGQGRPGPAGRR